MLRRALAGIAPMLVVGILVGWCVRTVADLIYIDSLDDFYALVRLAAFVFGIIGLGLAVGTMASAHLDVRACERAQTNGARSLLARSHRTTEALTLAAQLALTAFAWSLVAAPTANVAYQGIERVTFVSLAMFTACLRSSVMLWTGPRVAQLIPAVLVGGRRATDLALSAERRASDKGTRS